MTNLKKCAEDHFTVIYPYIKQVCFNAQQEKWLFEFYYDEILPYAKEIIENKFIAKQNISMQALQFLYIRRFFDFESRSAHELPNEAVCLHNGFNEIDPLLRRFQNAYYSNVWNKKPGFTEESFYSEQYPVCIRQLLKLSALFWIIIKLEQALRLEPNNKILLEHQKWVSRRIIIHSNNTNTLYKKMILESFQPNLFWYFLNGSDRFFTFFQMEKIRFKKTLRSLNQSLHYFLDERLDAHKILVDFPIATAQFSFNILFFVLLPYRFLRTLANEMFHHIKSPVVGLIERLNPRYKLNTSSHLLYLLFLGLIYGSVLTILGLPLLPVPTSWLPNIFMSPVVAVIPLSYLFFVPCAALAKSFYHKFIFESLETSELNASQSTIKKSYELDDMLGPESKTSLLYRYKKQMTLQVPEDNGDEFKVDYAKTAQSSLP